MKKWIILLLVLAMAGGGWWYFRRNRNEEPEYQTAPVTRGALTQAVTATGILNPVVNVQVGSQVSGNIFKLNADFNSTVKAGQLVAQLDPAVYLAIVHQCDGDLANSKAALELAQLTAKRKQELANQHAAPQADLDTALATLHQAEATVKIKEANLEKAKVDLDHCTVYSPIDGVVISRNVDVGQTVAAAMNAPVLFIIAKDLTEMQIDSAVAEADVGVATVGQDVDFTVDAYPYQTFRGKVSQVRNAPSTVQNVVTYDVVISVKNPELKLKPGMTANISIIVAQKEDALKVPNSALRFKMPEGLVQATPPPESPAPPSGGKKPKGKRQERNLYVMPPGGRKPASVPVKLGINDGVSTEITEGLKENDLVVIGATIPQSKAGQSAPNPFGGRRF